MQPIVDNIKNHRRELTAVFIVVVVALLSFGLGYMTAKDSIHTPIIIENRSGA